MSSGALTRHAITVGSFCQEAISERSHTQQDGVAITGERSRSQEPQRRRTSKQPPPRCCSCGLEGEDRSSWR